MKETKISIANVVKLTGLAKSTAQRKFKRKTKGGTTRSRIHKAYSLIDVTNYLIEQRDRYTKSLELVELINKLEEL